MSGRWLYIVEDTDGAVSYHRSLEGAKKRSDLPWHAMKDENEVWAWRSGVSHYQVTIRKVRLFE